MIVVIDGRLFQWDTGRKVRIVAKDHSTITEVHAYYEGESDGYKVNTVVDADAVIAPIPNILLQENKTIEICAVSVTEDGIRTVETKTCHVYARSKPPNYVYTETEAINVETIVRDALREAKESGEFTPEKGVDYYTEADKSEMVQAVLSALPDNREVAY